MGVTRTVRILLAMAFIAVGVVKLARRFPEPVVPYVEDLQRAVVPSMDSIVVPWWIAQAKDALDGDGGNVSSFFPLPRLSPDANTVSDPWHRFVHIHPIAFV